MFPRFDVSGPGVLSEVPEGEYVRYADIVPVLSMASALQFLAQQLEGTPGGWVEIPENGEMSITIGNPLKADLEEAVALLKDLIAEANWSSVGPKLETLAAARRFVEKHTAEGWDTEGLR